MKREEIGQTAQMNEKLRFQSTDPCRSVDGLTEVKESSKNSQQNSAQQHAISLFLW